MAKLPSDDMNAVSNLRLLGGSSDTKKGSTGPFSLKFDIHKVNELLVLSASFNDENLASNKSYLIFRRNVGLGKTVQVKKKHGSFHASIPL